MKVLYLTCLENTENNGIHKNQIFGLEGKGVNYHFLFLTPLFIIGRQKKAINRNKFTKSNVDEVKILWPTYLSYMRILWIPLLVIFFEPVLFYKIFRYKPDIVHCRNFLSSFLAVFLRKISPLRYKVVCDPRSVFVEESVIMKRFSADSFNFRQWKKIEHWVYCNSDACIGLSGFFAAYLRRYNELSYYVPALVSDNLIYEEELRREQRMFMGLTDKDIIFTYIGSIGQWHSIDLYIECLSKCFESIPAGYNMKIVLLTGNKQAIEEVCSHFPQQNILKTGQVPPSEVKKYLHISDYGIVPGSDNHGVHYDMLYSTMIASKAEEFLSSGLPVIVNSRITSLADMVSRNDAGFVFSHSKPSFDFTKRFDRARISTFFYKEFNATSVVSQYREIYNTLANE